MEEYSFSLMCTFKKIVKNVDVKVDVQKGALGFRKIIDNKCVSSIQFKFSFIIVKC